MLVRDIIIDDVEVMAPRQTVREAAHWMRDDYIGSLPATHRGRARGQDTSAEDALEGVSR